MSDSTITVYWPSGGTLSPEEWGQRLECLATRAECLVGRRDAPVQQRAAMAMEFMGLCWPSLSPEVVAGSCRASLLLNEPVVVAAAPADQLAEIHESLDEIWELARRDPEAAVVSIGPPLLERVRERGGKRKPVAAAAAVEPAAEPPEPPAAAAPEPAEDPDELPAAWRQVPESAPAPSPPKPLRDRSLRMAARPEPPAPPDPDPEPLPSPAAPVPDVLEPEVLEPPEGFSSAPQLALELGVQATTIGAWAVRNLADDDVFRHGRRVWFRHSSVVGVYVPRSERPLKASPPRPLPPVGWFNTAEAAELLDVAPGTLGRWRMAGRLGVEGVGWCRVLGLFYYSPAGVEGAQGCDLDSLIDEIRAEQ